MIPYILNILHNSGTSQDVSSICWKLRQFNFAEQVTGEELEASTKEALERVVTMGLVRKNAETDTYALANNWFAPEAQSFQMQLHDVVNDMPGALDELSDNSSKEFATTSELPSDCMGPGMGQRRSPAQIRAIAIYRRMREQREREEREAAMRARKRNKSRSRSRSRTRRSSSKRSHTTNRQSTARSRSRSRSTPRTRSTSRSRRR
ncbi:serine/arginine-rich splicing factor 6-like [Anopheles moucheti]|uniref:serine/arginine-rich splicing factor 6-like n=1 Tax=Anopheles moucheti TaxID=186751 RepID=UPI0022F11D27|nr:serine/arginine-rich splicing factor 6-like [Anopheles moucheti]